MAYGKIHGDNLDFVMSKKVSRIDIALKLKYQGAGKPPAASVGNVTRAKRARRALLRARSPRRSEGPT